MHRSWPARTGDSIKKEQARLLRFALLFMLAFIVLATGCSSRQQKTKEEFVREGVRMVQNKDERAAIIQFKNALDKDQNYFEARFYLAKAYIAIEKYDAAEKELQKIIRQNPGSREVHIEIARVMALTNRPNEALKELAQFLRNDSVDCDALEIAGWAHAVKEDFPVALTLLKKAVATCADQTSSVLSLATVLAITGDAREAETILGRVITKEPDNRKALFLLSQIQQNRKDSGAALQTLDRLIQTNSNDIEAQYRKGALLIERKEYDAALVLSNAMIKQYPNRAEGHYLQGVVFFHKKQYNDAIIALQNSLALQPNPTTYHFLGLSHYFRNEDELAISQFQKALDLQSTFVPSRVYLALLLLKQGRADDSIREAKTALDQDATDASAHNVLGSAYVSKGSYVEGLAELNKALAIDPSLADVHLKKALVALKRGKGQEAEVELNSAIRIKPEAQEARLTLALYYINNNKQSKAIDVLKSGLRGGREDAVSHYLIGESFLRQNKIQEAMSHFTKAREEDPKYEVAYLKIAWIHLMQEKEEQAIQELRSLITQVPNSVQGLCLLASFAELKGDEEEARKRYLQAADTNKTDGIITAARYFHRMHDSEKALKIVNEAIRTSPRDINLHEMKGQLLLASKNYRDALKSFEAVEQINPQAGFNDVITTYVAMGEPAKALERVRTAITKDPTNLGLRAELSQIYLRMGNKTEAVENARETVRKYPDSSAGYLILATVYQKSNEVDTAIETLRGAPKSKDAAPDFMLGNLYIQKKNYSAALTQFRKVEVARGESEQVLFQQASLLDAMGKKKEAEAEYLKLIRISPNHVMGLNNLAYLYADNEKALSQAYWFATRAFVIAPQNDYIRDTLGYVLIKKGRTDRGINILKKASEGSPNNPNILYHLALGYKQNGDSIKAAESLQQALSLGDFTESIQAKALLEKIKRNRPS